MAKKLNLDAARAKQVEYSPIFAEPEYHPFCPEVFLLAARSICDREEQTTFCTTEVKVCSDLIFGEGGAPFGGGSPAALWIEFMFDPEMGSFDGWHGELNDRDNVECRVLGLCFMAAITGRQ